MNDLGEPQKLTLFATASAEELWSMWQEMREVTESAGQYMTDLGEYWKQATDPAVKNRRWANYEIAARHYRVVSAWKDVVYAAFIFATDGVGTTCVVPDVGSLRS